MSAQTTWHRWRVAFAATLFTTTFFAAAAAEGQDPTTEANIDVRLEVYRAADLVVTPIDFGTVLINGDNGTLTMDGAGSLSFSGGILETYDGPVGTAQAGSLTLDAHAGAIANITVDPEVDLGSGVKFTPQLDETAVAMMGGPVTVSVYGSVDFPADTQTGTYDGLLTVNVSYQ